MAVFEYSTDEGDTDADESPETDSSADSKNDIKVVSVVDQGTGDYSYLRVGIPNEFAGDLDIEGGDNVVMEQVDGGLSLSKLDP